VVGRVVWCQRAALLVPKEEGGAKAGDGGDGDDEEISVSGRGSKTGAGRHGLTCGD
jgi:hypothetical protein